MDPISLQAYVLAPISRLPAEILLEIFDLVIEDCALIMEWYQEITHVCRYWRQLAITTARLWTNIPADSDCDNPYWTHTALERSKPAMLYISLYQTNWQTNLAILKHIARIKALDIQSDMEGLDKISFILSVVGGDAKELTWLTIRNESRREGHLFKLPDSFSAATKLEHLDLRYTKIDWKSPALMAQNLTWLTLHSTPLPESSPSWEDLLGALMQMPRLSMLDLTHTLPSAPPQPNTPIVHLSQLKFLIIAFNEPPTMRSFLSQVTFPSLSHLSVGCDKVQREEDYARVIQDVIRKAPASFADKFLSLIIDEAFPSISFSCQSYCNNDLSARSQRKITFVFSCDSGSLLNEIVRNTMVLLRLNTTMQSLDIRTPIVHTAQEFVDLFGSIDQLATISIRGGYGHYIAASLAMILYHLPAPTPTFLCLETIQLIRVDFQDNRSVNVLEDALIQRFENGVEIKALKFVRCRGLNSSIIKRFADIVVDVTWEEFSD